MDKLISEMKKTLADVFTFYLKVHGFHWNVEGQHFVTIHDFLGKLYEEIFNSIDPLAEQIRVLDSYAPAGLQRYLELTSIEESDTIPEMTKMITILMEDNKKVIDQLTRTCKLADDSNQIGLSNFLQSRIDTHNKYQWMLRSISN